MGDCIAAGAVGLVLRTGCHVVDRLLHICVAVGQTTFTANGQASQIENKMWVCTPVLLAYLTSLLEVRSHFISSLKPDIRHWLDTSSCGTKRANLRLEAILDMKVVGRTTRKPLIRNRPGRRSAESHPYLEKKAGIGAHSRDLLLSTFQKDGNRLESLEPPSLLKETTRPDQHSEHFEHAAVHGGGIVECRLLLGCIMVSASCGITL